MRSLTVVLVFVSFVASAQIEDPWDGQTRNFDYRVKSIDFFIDRFNAQPEGSGKAIPPSQTDSVAARKWARERSMMIFALFDVERLRKEGDRYLKEEAFREFLGHVNKLDTPAFLHFTDEGWYASFSLEGTYQNKPAFAQCVLKVGHSDNGGLEWLLHRVHSKEMTIDEKPVHARFAPSVHGTEFMGVRINLTDTVWVNHTRHQPGAPTSRFLDLLSSGKFKPRQLHAITYHFRQFEPWIFTVTYVNRESKNSGWLINKLVSTDVAQYCKENGLD